MTIGQTLTKTAQYTTGIEWVGEWGSKFFYFANPEPKLTNPITVTTYSLLLSSTSSTCSISQLQAVEIDIFSGEGTDKNTAQNSPKRHFKRKIHFSRPFSDPSPVGGVVEYPLTPRPTKPSGSASASPEFQPDLRLCNIQAYDWLCVFLHVSTIQLVLLVFFTARAMLARSWES